MRVGGPWRRRAPLRFFFVCEIVSIGLAGAGIGLVHAASPPQPFQSPQQPLSAIGGTLIGVGVVLGLLFLGLGGQDFFSFRNRRPQQPQAESLPEPVNPSTQQTGQPATEGQADQPATEDSDNSAPKRKITILMLGFQSSGKTLMLAALYHRFGFGNKHGVTLRPDNASERKLSALTKKLQEEDSFPEGTALAEVEWWNFDVRVGWEHAHADAFELAYLDYAGEHAEEILEEKTDEPNEQFRDALRKADILMGVLDGGKIHKLMTGDYDARLTGEIQRLLRLLILSSNEKEKRKSIHLVISKWDLFTYDQHGHHITLDYVVEWLERFCEPFRNFRKNPQFSSLRIIPVSALGSGFVALSPDGSTMTKIPGAQWVPENAEIPFYCAIPDIIKNDVERMTALAEGTQGRKARKSNLPGYKLAWATIQALAIANIDYKFSAYGIVLAIPILDIPGRIREALDRRQRPENPRQYDADAALAHVLDVCYKNMDDFEQDKRWSILPPHQRGA